MNMFVRGVVLLKVLMLLALGSSSAWAECPDHDKQALNGQSTFSEMMIAGTTTDTDDQSDDGDDSMDDDDSQT